MKICFIVRGLTVEECFSLHAFLRISEKTFKYKCNNYIHILDDNIAVLMVKCGARGCKSKKNLLRLSKGL